MHLIVCNFTPYFVDFHKNLCTKQKIPKTQYHYTILNLRYESSHGGDEESRTPVQKRCHIDLSEHSL